MCPYKEELKELGEFSSKFFRNIYPSGNIPGTNFW
jgi:hypothetical protein